MKNVLDGIPSESITNEMREAHHAKVKNQESLWAEIEGLPGFHLRYGTLKRTGRGNRKKEPPGQKMVDVQLAVNMMSFAFSGACRKFVIFAGDADFVPVIEALTEIGAWVTVVGFKGHTSPDLVNSADERVLLVPEHIFANKLVKEPHLSKWNPPDQRSWSEGCDDWIGWDNTWVDDEKSLAIRADFESDIWYRAIVSGDDEYGTLFGYEHREPLTLLGWLNYKYPETKWPSTFPTALS